MNVLEDKKLTFYSLLVAACLLCPAIFLAPHMNPGFAFFLFAVLFITFPDVYKYLICTRWPRNKGIMTTIDDLSKTVISNKGVARFHTCFEVEYEYSVEGKSYLCKVRKKKAEFGNEITVYSNPKDPRIYAVNKKFGLACIGFLLTVLFLSAIYIYLLEI